MGGVEESGAVVLSGRGDIAYSWICFKGEKGEMGVGMLDRFFDASKVVKRLGWAGWFGWLGWYGSDSRCFPFFFFFF